MPSRRYFVRRKQFVVYRSTYYISKGLFLDRPWRTPGHAGTPALLGFQTSDQGYKPLVVCVVCNLLARGTEIKVQ